MENVTSVNQPKNYGKIVLTLDQMIAKRDITRNKLAGLIGTRYEVINRFCQGTVERLDMDVAARICFALQCELGDIMQYVPPTP